MASPLPLPDWLPLWVHLLVLLALLFLALAFVTLPFSVWGTRSRLHVIEARLDEIQGEIRSLAFRLPERFDAEPDEEEAPPRLRAPIPPAPMVPVPPAPVAPIYPAPVAPTYPAPVAPRRDAVRDGRRVDAMRDGRSTRSEPRLY